MNAEARTGRGSTTSEGRSSTIDGLPAQILAWLNDDLTHVV